MTDAIRPATEADLPVITAIYGDAVRTGTASFETDPPTDDEMARRFAVLRDGGFPYLVAVRDGSVAGYAYAGPYHQRAAYRSTVEDSIYVARTARGCGIGGPPARGSDIRERADRLPDHGGGHRR